MKIPLTIRKGFNYDEALLMGKFCQQVYTIFQYDDGSVEDTELKEIYNSIHRNQDWEFVQGTAARGNSGSEKRPRTTKKGI